MLRTVLVVLLAGLPASPAVAASRLSQEPGGSGDAAPAQIAGPSGSKLVVWPEGGPGSLALYARLIDSRARPRGPLRRLAASPAGGVRLVYNPRRREYLAAFTARTDASVHVLRLDRHGRQLGGSTRVGDPSAGTPEVAADPHAGTYLIAYPARIGDSDVRLRVQPLDGTGRATGEPVTLTGAPAEGVVPDVAWSGRGFLVAYALHERIREGQLYVRAVDPSGRATGESVVVSADPERRSEAPQLVRAGSRVHVLWTEGSCCHPGGVLMQRLLDASGAPAGAARALTRWRIYSGFSLAPLGARRLLLAYELESAYDVEIHGRSLHGDGAPAGSVRRLTRTGPDQRRMNPSGYHATSPALSAVRGGAIMAWIARGPRDGRYDVYARRLRR